VSSFTGVFHEGEKFCGAITYFATHKDLHFDPEIGCKQSGSQTTEKCARVVVTERTSLVEVPLNQNIWQQKERSEKCCSLFLNFDRNSAGYHEGQ
jgi:hypothetical protein